MIKEIQITDKEHNDFVKSHPYGDIGQLTPWGELKEINGWSWEKINVGTEDRITGAALLLYKKIPKLNLYFCYANRGFVVDWNDEESAQKLTEAAVAAAKKRNAIMVRIDPDIDEREEGIIEKIQTYGFRHKGLKKGLYAYTQPRLHMTTDLSPDLKDVMKSFQSRTRTNVRKSLKNGLVFERAPLEKMPIFHEMMQVTGSRDEFSIRGLDYFQRMYEVFNPTGDCELFLVRLDPKEAAEGLKKDIENREREKNRLEKREMTDGIRTQLEQIDRSIDTSKDQLEDMEKLMETRPEGIYLSGAIYTQCGEKAYYLYGASTDEYRDLLPNYFMQWKMMEFAKEHGATSYDFGGITGRKATGRRGTGLYEFKRWGMEAIGRVGSSTLS